MDDYEVVAQDLSDLGEKLRGLEDRLAEVERVHARLEEAALTTARAPGRGLTSLGRGVRRHAPRGQNRPPDLVRARPRCG